MEASDLSSMISALTSDPAMMSRVMGALSTLSQGAQNDIPEPADQAFAENTESEEVPVNAVLKPASAEKSTVSDRKRLLYALKPYLNQSRREKAEMLINIMTLLDSGVLNMLGKGE
ncbi:MAG: hypothetical protein IJC50_07165 [Clostridia bacterium]|nr:hypothetical protein [Clostridia bacterium]